VFRRILIVLFTYSFTLTNLGYSQKKEKVVVLWCDPLLNISQISSRAGIIDILEKAQQAGVQGIALGVKTLSGEVIYESKVAPRLLDWEDFRVPLTFDPIRVFLEEGGKRRLEIYAVFTIFSHGHMTLRRGPIYNNHPEWQTQVYVVEYDDPRIIAITDWAYGTAAFANPLLEQVQAYEISVVGELIKKYDNLDGIIFDRVRFNSIESDFSDFTKQRFEAFLGQGQNITWWPRDIYSLQLQDNEWEIVPGELFSDWITFRAQAIHDFVERLVNKVHEVNRFISIGNFVGSWYPTYYEYGVNWASPSYSNDEFWASKDYFKTSITNLLDYLISGCYFPRITMDEAEGEGAEWWMSIEGGSLISMEVVNNDCPVYASVWVEQYKSDSEKFKKALKTAIELTDGLYIYDLSQIEKYKYWDEVETVIKNSPKSSLPHK